MDLVATDHRSEPRPGTRRSGRIACAPGFDLGRTLAFLEGFGPMGGEQVVEGAALTKAAMHGGRPVLFHLRGEETAGRPEIAYRITSKHTLSPAEEAALARRIAFFLSAGEDLSPFVRLAAEDPCFAPVAARLAGLHHVKFPTPFEAACWGVINQRIQRGRAKAMKAALCRRFGGVVVERGTEHLAFPEADTLARAGEDAIRAALGSDRKAAVVFGLARAFAEVDEAFLREAPLAEVEGWLRRIRGVGPFTASFVLFRGIGRFAGQPLHPMLIGAAQSVYGRRLSAEDMRRLGDGYGPWAGYWALYLWASTFL